MFGARVKREKNERAPCDQSRLKSSIFSKKEQNLKMKEIFGAREIVKTKFGFFNSQ